MSRSTTRRSALWRSHPDDCCQERREDGSLCGSEDHEDPARPGQPGLHRGARLKCRSGSRDWPDWLAFDLDPGSGAFADAARAGHGLREILEERGIRSYPKTSGGRGLHVLVPLRRGPTQEAVRAFAQDVGRAMAERAPRLVTVAMSKTQRRRRVFADVLRNAFGQTIVAPYWVRRQPKAPCPPRSTGTRLKRGSTQLS
jgi:LigD, primase-polymerase domain